MEYVLYVFFFKQKTAYEVRISDWSSDVCSSDLARKDGLAIQGGSNGGLLVGAVVNQRPDLFAAAVAQVGVMDMLRFDRFTAGRYWVDDYGYPDREADFKVLRAYSPYHNIREGRSEEHTSELQSLMRSSYAVFCLKKKNTPR